MSMGATQRQLADALCKLEEVSLKLGLKEAECERLRGMLEKLPKYEDTGERFVPGHDEAWVISNGACDTGLVAFVLSGAFKEGPDYGWGWVVGTVEFCGWYPAYSTIEAAKAAEAAKVEAKP